MKVCTMKPTYFSPILLALAIIITTPLALVTSSFIVGISSAGALTTKPPYKFRKPPNNGAPGTANAGGSRGDCKVQNPTLQAIAPIAPDKTVGGVSAARFLVLDDLDGRLCNLGICIKKRSGSHPLSRTSQDAQSTQTLCSPAPRKCLAQGRAILQLVPLSQTHREATDRP
jgi:hypothetical protein